MRTLITTEINEVNGGGFAQPVGLIGGVIGGGIALFPATFLAAMAIDSPYTPQAVGIAIQTGIVGLASAAGFGVGYGVGSVLDSIIGTDESEK